MFLAGASIISTGYTAISMAIVFYQVTRYINEFDHMKTWFFFVLLGWLLVVAIISSLYFKFDKEDFTTSRIRILRIAGICAAFSLSSFTGILMLSFAPTILLLFAFPVDTSSLLVLHIASFYSTTIVLAVFFRSVKEWFVNNDSIIEAVFCPVCYKENLRCLKCTGLLLYIILGLVLLALLPLTYVCLILLYQFVVARSEVNQLLAYTNFATYIPSIAIAVFGFVIKKGAFDLQTTKTERNNPGSNTGVTGTTHMKNNAAATASYEQFKDKPDDLESVEVHHAEVHTLS